VTSTLDPCRPAGQLDSPAALSAPPVRPQASTGTGTLLLLASIVVSFLAASSAPTPLYAVYAHEWHFTAITTTIVFGVYAIAVLSALLVLGRISDHIGRKPVLFTALALQAMTMVVFTTAGGLDALLIGRVLQGIATGGALGALGAAMLDVDRRRGTISNATAPGLGTGFGALVSGLAVQYLPAPTHLVYLMLIGVFALQALGVARMPETVTRKPGARASLVPELAVPRHLRGAVLAAAPALLAVWSVAGFYGSLAPSLVRQLSGSTSVAMGGLGLFVLAFVAAMATLAFDRVRPLTVMVTGIGLLSLGVLATYLAVEEGSTVGFFAGTFVAGIGFGAGFQGGIRTVVPLAAPHERAGVLSVLYVVSYLGMGAPAVGAGVLVVHGGGLVGTSRDYTVFVVALAALALLGLLLQRRSTRAARA